MLNCIENETSFITTSLAKNVKLEVTQRIVTKKETNTLRRVKQCIIIPFEAATVVKEKLSD